MAAKTCKTRTRIELLREFNEAPPDTLFDQNTIAALTDRSIASLERDRARGRGIPFIKFFGHAIRYRKSDYLMWEQQHRPVRTTAEAAAQATRLREVLNDAVAAQEG